MIPNELEIRVFAPGLFIELLPRVLPFHRWLSERSVAEILRDVVRTRHPHQNLLLRVSELGRGTSRFDDENRDIVESGIRLTSTHSPQVDDAIVSAEPSQPGSLNQLLEGQKWRLDSCRHPLFDALRRALTTCLLMECELSADGELFDAGSFDVLAPCMAGRPAFDIDEFATDIRARLTDLYEAPSSVRAIDRALVPAVRVRHDKVFTARTIVMRLGFNHARAS